MPKKNRPQPAAPAVFQGEQRINKVLAASGLGSRRLVDELIEQGRVEIDGKVIQQVGVKIDPDAVTISVDGEPLKRHRPIYFALHKPEGVLPTVAHGWSIWSPIKLDCFLLGDWMPPVPA